MDRRQFFKGAVSLAAVPGIAQASSAARCNVSVLGVVSAVNAADAIRWTAPLWLDDARFDLSVRLVAMPEWGPTRRLVGRYGDVPQECVRPWGDLSWMAEDLCGADLAIVLLHVGDEALEMVSPHVISAANKLVPRVAVLAKVPWKVVDGKLVRISGRDVALASARVSSCASQGTRWILEDGAPAERIRLAAIAASHDWRAAWDEYEACMRAIGWSETDELAAPVIRMLAKASRAHFLPSTAWRSPIRPSARA